MNRLASYLAAQIAAKITSATAGRIGTNLESRFLFHGPGFELLKIVYDQLSAGGGISVQVSDGRTIVLPVLLQMPLGQAGFSNPSIGASGWCDETHLLDLRNVPSCPSFVALVPPGEHHNRSVASTADEFGVSATRNSGHATFDEWWEDEFIQQLFTSGLHAAGIDNELIDDARALVELAARNLDEIDERRETRFEVWRLLSRIFSIIDVAGELSRFEALSLACGFPPSQKSGIFPQVQEGILEQLADALSDGFRSGLDRIRIEANEDDNAALDALLTHLQSKCKIPTAFERATSAFYLPDQNLTITAAPSWWAYLTVERWSDLLTEAPSEVGNLSLECSNLAFPVTKGLPAVVLDKVELTISIDGEADQGPAQVLLERSSGGARGKASMPLQVQDVASYSEAQVPPHKTPITYKASSQGVKGSVTKVISLATWVPGILVLCRVARKLSPPKKPTRQGAKGKVVWETTLSLPGAGRYELTILTSPGISLIAAVGIDDSSETLNEQKDIQIQSVKACEHLVEIEADAKYQLQVEFQRPGQTDTEICTAYLICEEVNEEGCRSEFERLINVNRRHLEKYDAKAVIQLDRHARSSSLQSWMIEEQYAGASFRPIVLADDYASQWSPPNWEELDGSIISKGRFLQDPRPTPSEFQAPPAFIADRREIARRIRATDDQSGLAESAPLGVWLAQDPAFGELVERYLDSYLTWFASEPDVACWVDTIAVTTLEPNGRTLARVPDAIILSPLHPLRLAWHCVAQNALYQESEGKNPQPCPAASILDPDCVPDLLTMSLRAPDGIELVNFISIECNSDYWSVLWNGSRLRQVAERSRIAPFDAAFGITVGGISSGFSAAQVSRALDDVSDLLAAKPIVSLVVSSAGGITDACNDGLVSWCTKRFGAKDKASLRYNVGPRMVQMYDVRPTSSRPDQATIANLSEDTQNLVQWFYKQPEGAIPDLGIIAQLDSAEPEVTAVSQRSPLGAGGLIRHRVRRQLPNAFLSESRQGLQMPPTGNVLADKISSGILAIESRNDNRMGMRFAPNVHIVREMLEDKKADFVAVSSAAIDPACFLGGWLPGAYLWDYDLPAYSHRSGDTSGYYLLSQIKEADRDALRRVLSRLPECGELSNGQVEQILLEVARRGIPTVRNLSGDDTGASGDLGVFIAVRLLQDEFRVLDNKSSLLQVLRGTKDETSISILVPVDPFRGYLADLAVSLGKERKDVTLSRPDLLAVGISLTDSDVFIRITPIEVKFRKGHILGPSELTEALSQARALSSLLSSIEKRAESSLLWKLAFQHLLLSMISFGLRVYSQRNTVAEQSGRWAEFHERIAAAILGASQSIAIDDTGRLIVVDDSASSNAYDRDGDGKLETIVISPTDAGRIIAGDPQSFYDGVRSKVGDWKLLPVSSIENAKTGLRQATIDRTVENVSPPAPIQPKAEFSNATISTPQAGHKLDEDVDASVSTSVESQSGIVLSVGKSVDGFEPRSISLNISDTKLNHLNIGVVGDLGTGKTQLLKSLISQIASAREENRGISPRFLIFDYKRDYSDEEFVKATNARVVKPRDLPLNLFDTSMIGDSPAPWLDRFRFFADVLDKIYSGIGPVQRDKLKSACRTAYETCESQGRQPTIYDIHSSYQLLMGGKSDSPMAIIGDIVDMKIFSSNPVAILSFNDFFSGVVVISLDAMGQDDHSKNMLVAIMLNMFYENMLKTPKRPFIGTDPQLRVVDSYLLVDEADNIMRYEFDVLRKLLLQGREFGTGVILASQYLRHFKAGGTDYREPLLTWCIHKVPNVASTELNALGFSSDLAELSERVKVLPNHHCLYKSAGVTGEVIRGLPFFELLRTRKVDIY